MAEKSKKEPLCLIGERSKNNEALKDLDFSMKRVRTHTNHGPYAGGQVSVAPTVSLNASVNQSDSMVKTKNQTFGPTGAVYMMMLQMKNLANPGQDANRIRNIAEKNMDETVNALKGIANNSFARATFDSMQDSVLEYYRGSLVSEAKKDLKDIQGVGGNAMRNARAALKASLNGAESKENKLKALNDLREGLKEGLPISETYLPPSSRKSFFSLARLFLSGRKVDDMNYLNMKSKAEVASDGANVIEQYINHDHKASRNPLSLSSAKKNVAKAEKTLDDLIDSMDYMQRKGALKDLIQQSVGNEDEKAELLETLARVKTSKNPEQKDVQQLMKTIKNAEDSGDPAFNKAHQREALNTSYESLLNQVQTLQQDDNANNRKATMDAFFDHSKNLEKFFKSAVYDPYRVDTYKSSQRQIAMFGNTLMSKIAHSVMDPLAAKIKAQPKLDSPLLLGGSASESQLSDVSQAEFDRAKMQALFKEKPIIPHGELCTRQFS